MNRLDVVRTVVWLDAMAERAKEASAELRAQLVADARAEYDEQGSAPSWRFADVGLVASSVSKASIVVEDEQAFLAWVQDRYPQGVEVITKVRDGWRRPFLDSAEVDGDLVVDPQRDEVVPGLGVRPGGRLTGVTVRPAPEAKRFLASAAMEGLKHAVLNAGPAGALTALELEPAPAEAS